MQKSIAPQHHLRVIFVTLQPAFAERTLLADSFTIFQSLKMKPLQAKLSQYTAPQEAKAAGIYPYFRAISSEQDPEVIIDGKKVLMFGSNCYTGLVNDPRIKEASIEATR